MEAIIFKTLLHSLWQGVLLAVLAALIVSVTTRANAKLRYNLFVGCLVLFIAGVGTTFCLALNNFIPSSSVNMMSFGSPVFGDTLMQPDAAEIAGPAILGKLITYLNNYSSSIVLILFLIICAKSIRFLVDIRTLMQIRTSQVYDSGTRLSEKVQHLALQYGIKQKVEILHSGIIKVPMVLGHFKPLILLPLGLINGLSMQEVDAILSHEMAHIKRRDYLVNVLQSAAEILFFFNPAVLWVSNMIRAEREHCCDDLAVANVETKLDYIKALVACQEFATVTPAYVMAINGGKGKLVYRVQRLISSRNQSLNKLEKVIIGLVLISAVAITTAFSAKDTEVERLVTKERKTDGDIPKPVQAQKRVTRMEKSQSQVRTVSKNKLPAASAGGKKPAVKKETTTKDMTQDLIADGLIRDKKNLSYELDMDELVVDGEKQHDVIHKKYSSKYLITINQKITVRVSTN